MLKGYRTLIVNALMAVLPILDMTEVRDILPAAWLPWYALGMAVVNMGLRAITTTPMGQKA